MQHILQLRAIEQEWRIRFIQTASNRLSLSSTPGRDYNLLSVWGKVNDSKRRTLWLRNWLINMGKQHLIPWLRALSIQHNLEFNEARVRAQRTLWGSCNSQKNISINCKLLFLPKPQVEHLFLHELCHTQHMNHSRKFWQLLASLDEQCKENHYALRNAEHLVPDFIQTLAH